MNLIPQNVDLSGDNEAWICMFPFIHLEFQLYKDKTIGFLTNQVN